MNAHLSKPIVMDEVLKTISKSIAIGIEKSTGKHYNIKEPTAPKEKL